NSCKCRRRNASHIKVDECALNALVGNDTRFAAVSGQSQHQIADTGKYLDETRAMRIGFSIGSVEFVDALRCNDREDLSRTHGKNIPDLQVDGWKILTQLVAKDVSVAFGHGVTRIDKRSIEIEKN